MNDRAPIRDRTLVLRILVPRLDQRLREKMKELEEAIALKNTGGSGGVPSSSPTKGGGGADASSYLDLEGVSCEPTSGQNRTLWNFRCDGVTYPAQLVNLPCPVEVHKTLDHASYYKAADIAQMLIVYEDGLSLDEAQEKAVEGFPSYYHSGLTPPMRRVVERRFERCFTSRDRKAIPPPRAAVQDVEDQLLDLMEKLQKDEKGSGGGSSSTSKRSNKLPTLTSATKDLVEIEEEIVDYEPWMDDNGKQVHGIEFDAEDTLAKVHPEIWLYPATINAIQEDIRKAQEEAAAKAAAEAAAAAPPTKKKKSKKKKAAAAPPPLMMDDDTPPPKSTKKGIPSRKNATPVDELTQAAMLAVSGEDLVNDALGDDLFADLDLDFSEMDNL